MKFHKIIIAAKEYYIRKNDYKNLINSFLSSKNIGFNVNLYYKKDIYLEYIGKALVNRNNINLIFDNSENFDLEKIIS